MTRIPRVRRLLCAFAGIATASALLHAQLADALVTRGDDAFRSGDIPAAIRAYDHAMHFDHDAVVASDRLAFLLALRHERKSAERSVVISSAALATHPLATALYADRGLAEMELREWQAAERDFAEAGVLGRDARYDHLAGRMALRGGDLRNARLLARRAVDADPAFQPARALLRELH